jgi:hypothetical protein
MPNIAELIRPRGPTEPDKPKKKEKFTLFFFKKQGKWHVTEDGFRLLAINKDIAHIFKTLPRLVKGLK